MAYLKLIREKDSDVSLGIVNQDACLSNNQKSISRVLSWQEGLAPNWFISVLLSAYSGTAWQRSPVNYWVQVFMERNKLF